ncbi:hypothetical protein B0H14DRAFT_3681438 [Mycena olivaceomarginata]|nr:hypothetical protein B0H14DRAFT_3681438 [Mycena olivaceomarginata]
MSTYPSDSSETRPIPCTPDEKSESESFAFQYDSSRSRLASPDQDFSVPDGGLVAWMTVAGATFGYLYSFGVYETFYSLEYLTNHTPSSNAWIGSFQLMMPFTLGIVLGKLFDNGHFHLLQITGRTIFTFSLFMLSLAKPMQYY